MSRELREQAKSRSSFVKVGDRRGYRLVADWGHVTLLEGGCHFCELSSNKHGGMSPLWRPPWTTIDPHTYNPVQYQTKYGGPPDGRLLAGITGHNLSFDYFGPPSKEETAAGLSTHGEASWRKWKLSAAQQGRSPSLDCCVELSDAQIQLRRIITLEQHQPVVYCEETATSLTNFDRPISWAEHVTFGPPFLEPGVSAFDMSATRAKVCPAAYGSRLGLRPDAEFRWPYAPTMKARVDLRRTAGNVHGRYTAQLMDSRIKIAWVAASNAHLGLLVLYLFQRSDFPWVGNWEERFYRKNTPWEGKTFCRGIEFSTTPFPVPRRESVTRGRLFGQATYRWLPARSAQRVRYLILLLDIPKDFLGVAQVFWRKGNIEVIGRSTSLRTIPCQVRDFLC